VKESSGSNGHSSSVRATPTNSKEIKKTRNLEIYVRWYNQLCAIVSTDVSKVRLVLWILLSPVISAT